MRNQQEKEPADLLQLFTKQEASDINLKTDMLKFNTQEAPKNISAHIQTSQSTPPQIENPSEAHERNQPSNPRRPSARKALFKDTLETESPS
ncbi:hypothetical protein Tco_1049570, partial [Tanacetum coccineum]